MTLMSLESRVHVLRVPEPVILILRNGRLIEQLVKYRQR